MTRLLKLVVWSATLTSTMGGKAVAPWGCMPRGGSDEFGSAGSNKLDYIGRLETVKADVLLSANGKIEELRRELDAGSVVSGFGSKCDSISIQALEEYAKNAPDAGDDEAMASAYDRKLEELEASVDAPLQVLYLRTLAILREEALLKFRSESKSSGSSEYEAMLQADAQFSRGAEDATRDGSDWDYSSERTFLQNVMSNMAESTKRATDIQLKSSQTHQTAMQFLQQQQQMIQQLQMQLYGQSSPWNMGLAYRIPDTNFNLQGSYQQGKTNVQLSCVPDEYAPFLGPNGFTNGVGPGNLGLSLNLSI